ncbi:hypothetical protein EJ05DRAFT_483494 [Pseudovirgaria hyperparasitica]|uniref:Uncharacterized protein n=1 Tax=Pseudovirgaria hyperparasitica TaxID=470096 RepID=A0A6A6WE49_9PEZI|nr:uncharacterized protein EJ05DRAFT_483494 [Pseudovirgaria hyperparasitica]KAF2761088.1 hypothetical protein EJ05DRAFT_483494 [Pseudovirgaria hyperparasitica]
MSDPRKNPESRQSRDTRYFKWWEPNRGLLRNKERPTLFEGKEGSRSNAHPEETATQSMVLSAGWSRKLEDQYFEINRMEQILVGGGILEILVLGIGYWVLGIDHRLVESKPKALRSTLHMISTDKGPTRRVNRAHIMRSPATHRLEFNTSFAS